MKLTVMALGKVRGSAWMQKLLRIWPISELNVQNIDGPYLLTQGLIHSDEFSFIYKVNYNLLSWCVFAALFAYQVAFHVSLFI